MGFEHVGEWGGPSPLGGTSPAPLRRRGRVRQGRRDQGSHLPKTGPVRPIPAAALVPTPELGRRSQVQEGSNPRGAPTPEEAPSRAGASSQAEGATGRDPGRVT